MSKHLSFWIGFFAAALLIVPIAVGVWGAAGDLVEYWAVFLFGGIVALLLVLGIFLFFRDAILRRAFGRGEATLQDVTGALVKTVSAASAGDRDAAEQHAIALTQTFAGWYAWSNLYRWVIATALGLLLAFGAFTGTVLLFEQNRKLGQQTETLRTQTETLQTQTERLGEQTDFMRSQTDLMQAQTERLEEQTEAAKIQNEIMTLNLVNQLREQMLASVEKRSFGEWLSNAAIPGPENYLAVHSSARGSCQLWLDQSFPLSGPPSEAAIRAIAGLAKSDALGPQVIEALELLALDTHGSVALGAVLALQAAGKPFEEEFTIRDLFAVSRIGLNDLPYRVNIRRSYLMNFSCPSCSVHMTGSIYGWGVPIKESGHSTIVLNAPRDLIMNGMFAFPRPSEVDPHTVRSAFELEHGRFFLPSSKVFLFQPGTGTACTAMREFDRNNPLVTQKR